MPSTTRKSTARASSRAGAAKSMPRAAPSSAVASSPLRWRITVAAGAAVAAIGVGGLWAIGQGGDTANRAAAEAYVGADLHTLSLAGGRLYVGGHDGVAVSTNGGKDWAPIASLRGADAMGWAVTPAGILVGGHMGLFRSTDGGSTFTKLGNLGQVSDVHALGAAGSTVYLASPQAGLLVSNDGGLTWQLGNPDVGRTFMGTILVDPANPQRLVAPDMQSGVVTSSDGGTTWERLGGPMGAMAVTWDPGNTRRLVAVGMNGGAISNDAGRTWTGLTLPADTSAVTFSADGRTLYAAARQGSQAHIYRSTDGGATWTSTA